MLGLVGELAGPLAHERLRAHLGRSDDEQQDDKQAQQSACAKRRQRTAVAENAASARRREYDRPAVVEIHRRGLRARRRRATPESHVGATRVVAKRHGHVPAAL